MLTYFKILFDGRLAKMDARGASAVEYGLLIAGIAALIVLAVFTLGGHIGDLFDKTSDCIQDNTGNCTPAAG